MDNKLINQAMQIILHAGNARNNATDALHKAEEFKFEEADQLLKTAEEEITLAHKAQTETIQNEANGIHYDINLLFIHAQDTLMTINSELILTREMISVLKVMDEKLKQYEKQQ